MAQTFHVLEILRQTIARARRRNLAGRLTDALLAGTVASTGWVFLALIATTLGIDISTRSLLLLLTATVGMLLLQAIRRRPSSLAIAMDLDQRNHLHELLSTAWAMRENDDPFTLQMRRQAEALAGAIALPRAGGRYSPRTHAAAFFALATSVVAALLARSVDESRSGLPDSPRSIETRLTVTLAQQMLGVNPPTTPEGTTDTRRPGQSRESEAGGSVERRSNSGSDARGAGRGDVSDIADPSPIQTATAASNRAPSSAPNGRGSGGASEGMPGDGAGGRVNLSDAAPAAPWTTSSWPARRGAALADLDAGRIPDSYRELVKTYFDR